MPSFRERVHTAATPTGVGLGLRAAFLRDAKARLDGEDGEPGFAERVAFVEVSPENYMERGGSARDLFEAVVERVPVITHGLMMSLGGLEPFSDAYFANLRRFLAVHGGAWHSDHMCFSTCAAGGDGGREVLHDLLPVPLTEASARRFAARVREAQDRLERPMAVENISYYLPMGPSEMSEAEFITLVCEEADCGVLLDVNNVYVNSRNFGFDPDEMVAAYPLDRVVQLHVAGHTHWERFDFFLDDHGSAASPTVHRLMAQVIERIGPVPVLLERDEGIPPLDELLDEVARLQVSYDEALARRSVEASDVA